MSKPRALDLFCCGGGVSVGLARAGFDVVGVDSNPKCEPYWRRGMEPYGGEFFCADALEYPLEGFDLICASPPCQRYSTATKITGRADDHPDLIAPTRDRLVGSGIPYCIENVPGSPLGSAGWLIMLCGTMFGLMTPDGHAEIRRHRLFEVSFSIPLRPACQHGEGSVITVTGDKPNSANTPRRVLCVAGGKAMSGGMAEPQGMRRRRAMSVAGNTPQTNLVTNQVRETFSIDDARAAMGIPWMPMKYLSQAIPPAYAEWIGRQALQALGR